MKVVAQEVNNILDSLSPLEANWMDETAREIVQSLESISLKNEYDRADIRTLIDPSSGKTFRVSKFCIGLFLGFSKDKLEVELKNRLGPGGTGLQRYLSDPDFYIDVLEELGLRDAMTATINTRPKWSDILKERLRSGRGSAVQGQKRGRDLEDFAEEVIREVFGSTYEVRCTFQGVNGVAKCDFAIPTKETPLILIEAKGYGATGSKMSDIIGDIDAIIGAKRSDAKLFLITDGLTWKARVNDLRKLILRQNDGRITRIYSKRMRESFKNDLIQLKKEFCIGS